MDQSIISILGGSGSLGLIALVLIEIYKLYTNNKKTDQSQLILDLQKKVLELESNQKVNQIKIETLESTTFDLKTENAELRGLLFAQEDKEASVKKFIANRKVAKKTKSINVT